MAKRPTVMDLREMRGKRQLTMLRTTNFEDLEAAQRAGIDMVSVTPEMILSPKFREVAPTVFAMPGLNFFDLGNAEDAIRWSFQMYKAGADAVYCSASVETIRRMAEEGVPVIGHVGLIPSKATWTGGFRAVGKTAEEAMKVMKLVRRLEEAGAFGAEIEVVPAEIATEIHSRTSLFLISMGAGTGCDCQYLFAEDVLGENRGHYPRHSKVYRNFRAELDRLQEERVAAFKEYKADVDSGAYPEARHLVAADPVELEKFRKMLDSTSS